MDFSTPLGFCPKCDEEGTKQYATRSKKGKVVCPRGHTFENDVDFNYSLTIQEKKKNQKESNRIMKNIISGSGTDTPSSEDIVPAIETRKSTDIVIGDIDKARLETLVGDFNDTSTLVGRIFALDREKRDLEDIIKGARKIKVGQEDGQIIASGDLKIEFLIPERHVAPILDQAHSYSQSVTRYVNERAVTLFDDMLFYTLPAIFSAGILWKILSLVHSASAFLG